MKMIILKIQMEIKLIKITNNRMMKVINKMISLIMRSYKIQKNKIYKKMMKK